MAEQQQTLSGKVCIEGIGLHSGKPARVTFLPAPEGHGIVFRRSDLKGTPEIAAQVDRVVEVERGTVLQASGARVRTVEHVLAAVAALEIDNLVIELDGEEPPAADGSAAPFAGLLADAGVEPQQQPAHFWTCATPFVVRKDDARYEVTGDDRYVISGSIDYENPIIRRQHASYAIGPKTFRLDVAPARTFGFIDDAADLRAAGLARGADTTNTVVLTADGLYAGVKLRYEDEFVRHKILDIIGDLALVGRRIRARIVAERPGHRGNIELARAIVRRLQDEGSG